MQYVFPEHTFPNAKCSIYPLITFHLNSGQAPASWTWRKVHVFFPAGKSHAFVWRDGITLRISTGESHHIWNRLYLELGTIRTRRVDAKEQYDLRRFQDAEEEVNLNPVGSSTHWWMMWLVISRTFLLVFGGPSTKSSNSSCYDFMLLF